MSEATYIFQKVRDAARIEEVVGEHVSLRPAGRELVGLCPFHDDRRPSMHVVPHKQIYWCFVCGAGGDVFRFVQNYHKMSAGEALRFLAQKYGVKLPEFRSESPGAKQAASLREKTFAANQWAAKIFKENLRNSSGRTALKYLLQRGLTDKTIEEFELGFAPDGWTHLVSAAVRDGVSSQLLIGSGLLKERSDGSPFDAFRNRVIFPIQDLGGRIIGFGGRILPGSNTTAETSEAKAEAEQEGPKYLNTPETTLFSKRETLYALDKSRQTIMKSECAIVVEGYMDVIGCHQAGVGNVVATLGTALTQEHVKLLRRFTNKLVLVFDSDEAGRRAADRAIELLLKYPVDVHIASVPDGKDPCDYCMTHGGEAFSELIANAPDALEFKWQLLIGTFNKSESLAQKQEAATAMLRLMAPVVMDPETDPIRRGLLEEQIGDLIGIPPKQVYAAIRKMETSQKRRMDTTVQTPKDMADTKPIDNTALVAQQWVLGSLLTDFFLYEGFRDEIDLELFTPELRPMVAKLVEYLEGAAELGACSLAEFLGILEDENQVKQAIAAQTEAEKGGKLKQKLTDALQRLQHDRQLHTKQNKPSPEGQPDWAAICEVRKQADKSGVSRRDVVLRPPKGGV
ncbi:MAG TPA: DNA primase [Phycisphaerae bacterium]|nr:DNA primase [Phycisphaerae bacterium]